MKSQAFLAWLPLFCLLSSAAAVTCHNSEVSGSLKASVTLIAPTDWKAKPQSVILTSFKNVSQNYVRLALVGPAVQNPLTVYDAANHVVWDRYGTADHEEMAVIVDLRPGDFRVFMTTWKMFDLKSEPVEAGRYRITSSFLEAPEIPLVSCEFQLR